MSAEKMECNPIKNMSLTLNELNKLHYFYTSRSNAAKIISGMPKLIEDMSKQVRADQRVDVNYEPWGAEGFLFSFELVQNIFAEDDPNFLM